MCNIFKFWVCLYITYISLKCVTKTIIACVSFYIYIYFYIMKQWCCLLDACVFAQRKLLFSTADTSGRFAFWLQNFPAALNAVGKISNKHIGNSLCLGSRETTTRSCVQQTCHLLGNTSFSCPFHLGFRAGMSASVFLYWKVQQQVSLTWKVQMNIGRYRDR